MVCEKFQRARLGQRVSGVQEYQVIPVATDKTDVHGVVQSAVRGRAPPCQITLMGQQVLQRPIAGAAVHDDPVEVPAGLAGQASMGSLKAVTVSRETVMMLNNGGRGDIDGFGSQP